MTLRVLHWLFLLWLVLPSVLLAHATGESYVFVTVLNDGIEGRIEFNEQDVRDSFGLDVSDIDVTPEIVGKLRTAIEPYVLENFAIYVDGVSLSLEFGELEIADKLGENRFVQWHFDAPWIDGVPDRIELSQTFFFERNPRHRSLLLVEYNAKIDRDYGEEYTALIFSPNLSRQELDLTDISGTRRTREFVWQGTYHILIGYDHILFLFTLLLPAVLARRGAEWQSVPKLSRAMLNVLTIVTMFTIAHSITLTLAALNVITMPSRWVESVIALSVLMVALNNLRPVVRQTWIIIFLFGLFHGLGFATVMGHLTFRMVDLVRVMLAFNIGVELGQVAIVLVIFPILFLLRRQSWYVPVILNGGSVIIAVIALVWFVQRAFAI